MATGSTKAERVFHRLRADILAGRHQPGERLRYAELCEQYDTSMGVLREALLRLAEQELVKGEAQQGFQVVSLSADDLLELTEARRELETLTLRHAIADGDLEWESRLSPPTTDSAAPISLIQTTPNASAIPGSPPTPSSTRSSSKVAPTSG